MSHCTWGEGQLYCHTAPGGRGKSNVTLHMGGGATLLSHCTWGEGQL